VDALAVHAEWNGRTIRVLEPISLLASKQGNMHAHATILLPQQMVGLGGCRDGLATRDGRCSGDNCDA